MKKMLAMLACVVAFIVAGCAGSKIDYQLDATATATSGWAENEKVSEGLDSCFIEEQWGECKLYRLFLGATAEGYYVVQDFYGYNDVKMTDPYLLLQKEEVTAPDFSPFALHIFGDIVIWHTNGNKWYQGQFDEGEESGLWKVWHYNGTMAARGKMQANSEVGEWIYWYDNGQKSAQGSFENAEQVGLWTQWYENGVKSTETHFVDGYTNGMWTRWHPNGLKKAEGMFNMNEPVGVWREWDEAGNLVREENRDE